MTEPTISPAPRSLVRDRTSTLAVAGGVVWLLALTWLHPLPFETGWAIALLLLSPLVLVPLGLRLAVRPRDDGPTRLWQLAALLQLPATLLLVLAFALPEGLFAALLCLPWLATTAALALLGLLRTWQRGLAPLAELCVDAGLVYLAVGGGWAVLARWGARPLEFESVIVLLTAIHFHHAGFVLPLLTGLAAHTLGGVAARLAAVGVLAGVPLVAVGITATQLGLGPILECLAASLTSLAGLLAAWLHLRLAADARQPWVVRSLWAVAAVSLAGSMVLAGLYGCRAWLPVDWLDIPWMRALHGSGNALGFGLIGTLAWALAKRTDA